MILLGILLMIAALAWLWRWIVRHEANREINFMASVRVDVE